MSQTLIEAGSGQVILVSYDERTGEKEAGPWWYAACENCPHPSLGFPQVLPLGYFQSEPEAKAAAARHVEEAGDRDGPPPGWLTQ